MANKNEGAQVKKIFLKVLGIIFVFIPAISSGYDEKIVHPAINEFASRQSILDTQNLLTDFGFDQGLLTELMSGTENKTILKWISQGGTDEDKPKISLRFANHFHDPLKEWDAAGLHMGYPFWFDSSIFWAQIPTTAEEEYE
ncbi:MAG: hypothetical protein KKE17_10990 [Proteobacteria bacterium]|nr:hypothetical protein [Pseudomonadota bacterium]